MMALQQTENLPSEFASYEGLIRTNFNGNSNYCILPRGDYEVVGVGIGNPSEAADNAEKTFAFRVQVLVNDSIVIDKVSEDGSTGNLDNQYWVIGHKANFSVNSKRDRVTVRVFWSGYMTEAGSHAYFNIYEKNNNQSYKM